MRFTFMILVSAMMASPANAEPKTTTIKVTAVDLESPKARAQFNRRLARAIERVCGSYASIAVDQWPGLDACWRSARAAANDRIAAIKARHVQTVSRGGK